MPNPDLMLAISGVLAVLFLILVFVIWRRSRVSPAERERRRRATLAAYGKMGDAALLEVTDSMVVYAYSVGGVEYTASQDISRLGAFLPSRLSTAGHATVKYDPRNPANSIIIAERWSGVRLS